MNNKPSSTMNIATHAALICVVVATLFPVMWVIKMAFRPEQTFATGLNPFPTTFSLQNFTDLFKKFLKKKQLLFIQEVLMPLQNYMLIG